MKVDWIGEIPWNVALSYAITGYYLDFNLRSAGTLQSPNPYTWQHLHEADKLCVNPDHLNVLDGITGKITIPEQQFRIWKHAFNQQTEAMPDQPGCVRLRNEPAPNRWTPQLGLAKAVQLAAEIPLQPDRIKITRTCGNGPKCIEPTHLRIRLRLDGEEPDEQPGEQRSQSTLVLTPTDEGSRLAEENEEHTEDTNGDNEEEYAGEGCTEDENSLATNNQTDDGSSDNIDMDETDRESESAEDSQFDDENAKGKQPISSSSRPPAIKPCDFDPVTLKRQVASDFMNKYKDNSKKIIVQSYTAGKPPHRCFQQEHELDPTKPKRKWAQEVFLGGKKMSPEEAFFRCSNYGTLIHKFQKVVQNCGNKRCVEPTHLEIRTRLPSETGKSKLATKPIPATPSKTSLGTRAPSRKKKIVSHDTEPSNCFNLSTTTAAPYSIKYLTSPIAEPQSATLTLAPVEVSFAPSSPQDEPSTVINVTYRVFHQHVAPSGQICLECPRLILPSTTLHSSQKQ
jgi:hypothetical protein